MYSSGYSQVSTTQRMAAQKNMKYRSTSKGCGYYMRIVFFFSSLIQSLIIVSLVLFLVYGKKQDSASTTRIQDLEEAFSRLSIENVLLRQQRKNLTNLLNNTLIEKVRNDWDLGRCRYISNISRYIIEDLNKNIEDFKKKQQQHTFELLMSKNSGCPSNTQRGIPGTCNCGLQSERLSSKLQLVESNFTQTAQRMRMELDQISKERDNMNLEVIHLRRDKSTHEKAMQFYKIKCKDDFSRSLSGVNNVSSAFLLKISSLFPAHLAFQLTCEKQRDHLEQIRTNCTNLSRDVEDKFQRYLNNVGEQMATIQSENSILKAENSRFNEDYRWCNQNRTGMVKEHKQNIEKFQLKYDKDKEKLLNDKIRLNGQIEVLENSVKYKNKEVEHLTLQLKQLNMSCMLKTAANSRTSQSSQSGTWNLLSGGSSSTSSSSSSLGQLGRTGSGVGSILNSLSKPVSTGQSSSSSGSTGSSSSLTLNKLATSGKSTSSSSSSGSTGSLPSLSSLGLGLNKPATTGQGSSSSGSTGSILSSSGLGSYKPTTNVKSSPSSGSTGSSSKIGSSFSLFGLGLGSSSTGQSKTGSGTGKGTSTGSSSSGTGSIVGTGRTTGLAGGSVNLAQHLQDLQRIINPPGPEEKQDLSRMLG